MRFDRLLERIRTMRCADIDIVGRAIGQHLKRGLKPQEAASIRTHIAWVIWDFDGNPLFQGKLQGFCDVLAAYEAESKQEYERKKDAH